MKRFFPALSAIVLAIFASYAMLLGSGFFAETEIAPIVLFSLLILLLCTSKKSFYLLLLPIAIPYIFYIPIGKSFGSPSYQYVASVFATDLQESKEFFSQIPLLNFALAIATLIALFLIHWLSKKFNLRLYRNKTFMVASLVTLFFTSNASKFLHESVDSILKVKAELQRLNSLNIESQWGNSTLSENSRYDDYVLIIGESARKDYHHAYGYPIENTPFMSNAKGTLIDGLTAGGTNTIASLKLMLTQPNKAKWEGNYALNLVDLAKSAGIRTFWLSNQGYLGSFDTPVSSIANKSDEKFFTKAGDSFNQNISDFKLLPKFEHVLGEKSQGKRLIVLHLYGSHPIACDRLTDYPKMFNDAEIDPKHANLNCYVSSIKKTDELLQKVHQQLTQHQQKTGRTFSMVYFSDHGLAHSTNEKSIDMLNMSRSQFHLDVPLFKISSDDVERKVYKAFKSGLNFTDGLGNWLGITNPKLDSNIDLFSPTEDKDDYGLQKLIEQHYDKTPDPAIDIRK